jgi:peptide/nickel transport system substrate-binding protein
MTSAGAVEVRSLEFGTLFNDIRRGNFEMVTLKWASVIEPDLLRGVYHSKNVPTEENHWGGWNRGALVNPEPSSPRPR